MSRERFYVEAAPGYVRLRHQLGLRPIVRYRLTKRSINAQGANH